MSGKRLKQDRGLPPAFLILLVLVLALTCASLLLAAGSYRRGGGGAAPFPTPSPAGPASPSPTAAPTPEPEPTPTPQPTPEPTPTPEPAGPYAQRAQEILGRMSLHEKVCQLFIVSPEHITGAGTVTAAGDATRQALEAYPVAGFLYDRRNLLSREQVTNMLQQVQEYASIPLILTCDEEGGRVSRLMRTVGTTRFGPMLDYKDQGPDIALSNARTIAGDLRSCGFNMNLAPVADVWSNPANTVIGDRAYSDSFEEAAVLVAAAVEGFHAGGIACTLKHFPGHGDTSADSHYGSVYVNKPLEEIRREELLPFQAGIDAGADAVMIGHLIVSDVDDQPALFSYELVTGLLREEMGFSGVVITDGLQMKAMSDHYSSAEIAVKGLQAGVDLFLCPMNLKGAVQGVKDAVADGTISQQRLDESVLRILELKLRWGIIS